MRNIFGIKISPEKFGQVKDTVFVSWRMLKIVYKIDRRLFLISFFGITIPAIIPFVNIYIYKLVIDFVVRAVTTGVYDLSSLYPLVALRIFTYFLQDFALQTQSFVERILWTKIPIELNQMFYGKLSTLDIHYFENDQFRDLMIRAREGYNHRPQNLIDNLFFSFQNLVQFLIALVTLAGLSWFFIVLIAVVAIPEFLSQNYQSKLSWGIWSNQSPFRKRYNYLSHLLEGIREVKEVRIFRLAKALLSEIKEIQQKFYLENKEIAQKSYYLNTIFNVLSSFVFIGIEAFVILEALAKRITIGDINFYTGVVTNFQNGMGGLLRNLNAVYDNSLYVKNIFEILDAEPIVKIRENAIKLDLKKAPLLEFNNVSFSYPGSKVKILNSFSLAIQPGEKIAFVGENGVGKSTIIKLLARFYDIDKGEILINGINIKDLDLQSWYNHIGILFQDFIRYEHTAKENIYFGNIHEPLDMRSVIEAAVSSGAHKLIDKFEKKYDQILGKMFEGGVELSGGQWQKIALARAFFRNAPVLVLDEPTAAIDAKAESEIFSRVEKLSKDKTVIIISHRFSTVRNADKIYVIDNGKITESGTHKELMKLNGQYATLFNLQAKGYQ